MRANQFPDDKVLWVPPEAILDPPDTRGPIGVRNGWSIYIDGTMSVVFDAPVGRDDLVPLIRAHFKQIGWREASDRYYGGSQGTTFKTGWFRRPCGCVVQLDADGNMIPRQPQYEWRGAWRSRNGDVVNYVFSTYAYTLRGIGSYYPSELVKDRRW